MRKTALYLANIVAFFTGIISLYMAHRVAYIMTSMIGFNIAHIVAYIADSRLSGLVGKYIFPDYRNPG
jgi:hypothetical protein